MVTKRDDNRRQGEYRAIFLWKMDWQSFAITKPQICNSRNQRVRRERRIQVFIKKQCDLKEIISEVLMGNVDF